MYPKNLLVAPTEVLARRYISSFGLNPSDWRCVGYGYMLAGSRFDKIIIIEPKTEFNSSLEKESYEDYCALLRIKLYKNAEIIFL
jgi:hypothetical protein